MALPPELQQSLRQRVRAYQEENPMTFLSSFELEAKREGIEEGIEQEAIRSARQSVLDALDVRFADVPTELRDRLEEITDAERLRQLYRRAIVVPTLTDFEQLLEG